MTNTSLPLKVSDVLALADVINGVFAHAKARLLLDDGNILEGTLRYLDGEQGAPRPTDVRDTFVRITSLSGFEYWFPLTELATKHNAGAFAIDRG